MNKWQKSIFHEKGSLNLRSIRSKIIHIKLRDDSAGRTLCGEHLTNYFYNILCNNTLDFKTCPKCLKRYLNRINYRG